MDNISYSEILTMILTDLRDRVINNMYCDECDSDVDVSCDEDVRSSLDRATANALIQFN